MPIIFPTKQIIKKFGIHPSRQRSQNFLVDRNSAEKAVSCAGLTPEDTVIEIGPGPGSLTFFLHATGARVICYEIDHNLHRILSGQVPQDGSVTLLFQDILKADFGSLLGDVKAVIFGSIPYAITSPIIIKILEDSRFLKRAVFIVQKEVAERLCAPPGCKDYGILTVYCRAYLSAAIRMIIPAACFYPEPKVDSAVIELTPLAKNSWHGPDEELFRMIVRTGFSQRRKTFQNCLKAYIGQRGIDAEKLKAATEAENIALTRRAETFTVEEFYRLAGLIRRLTPHGPASPHELKHGP
jgi:16S rRNA (adenine1518-N6/adenine1519-N6)-dimethyltransferase